MKKLTYLFLILISPSSYAQFSYSLVGNPVNTTGWTLSNNTSIANDVVVLNNPQGTLAAFIYYNQPVDLTTCSKFTLDFDFSITDPSPQGFADGIAFWYITTPPTGFVQGLGIGVPTPATGMALYLDTYDNDGNNDNPRVALRQLQNNSYIEGLPTNSVGVDITNQAFITDGAWHHCQVIYNNNIISVAMDGGAPVIVGNLTLNMTGYFGFSSSTGAAWSKHMLRNVTITGVAVEPPVAQDISYCEGDNATPLTAAGTNLLWYATPSGGTPLAAAPTPDTDIPGLYYWYVSQSEEGCGESGRDTLTVTVKASPNPPSVMDLTYCLNAQAEPLSADGQDLMWYDHRDGAGSPGPIIPSTNTVGITQYFVTQTIDGCESDKATINVNVTTVNGAVSPVDAIACQGGQIALHADGGGHYRWYDTPDFSTAASLDCNTCSSPVSSSDVVADIHYNVIITSEEGCIDTLQSVIHYVPTPVVTISPEYSKIKYGTSVQLEASGALYYTWTPSGSLDYSTQSNPNASPKEPTQYIVTGFSENGCTDTDSSFVDVDFTNPIYIPSAFTPNNDGRNDVLKILNLNFLVLTEYQIVNRWGAVVFSTTDPDVGWDGRYKGVPQEAGVYFYIIRASNPNGAQVYYKGDITLLR